MGINFKCPHMEERPENLGGRRTVLFYCDKKGHGVKSCTGCKIKTT